MDFSRRDDGGGCGPCPFSEPGKGAASDPVYQSPPGQNDPDCFIKTGDAFLSSLDAAGSVAPRSITADGCKALAAIGGGGQIFYALYELDKSYCGLGPINTIGDDREFAKRIPLGPTPFCSFEVDLRASHYQLHLDQL